ncbi:hypothetical protein K7432_011643 [Basidiobolus ranarum]|uniref:Uncharacterized protein n=1 Tax=Basidiobolus ranarum TaxID=34480 RepID=A0ABR2VUF1_9FUNG
MRAIKTKGKCSPENDIVDGSSYSVTTIKKCPCTATVSEEALLVKLCGYICHQRSPKLVYPYRILYWN